MSAKIPHTRLDIQLAVGPDGHNRVPADGAGAVWSHGDSETADLRSSAFSRVRLALVPFEDLTPAIESFPDKRARRVRPLPVLADRPVLRFSGGGVESSNRDLIDAEFFCSLGDYRLDDPVGLHWSRRSLLRTRRSVGQDVDGAPPHGG